MIKTKVEESKNFRVEESKGPRVQEKKRFKHDEVVISTFRPCDFSIFDPILFDLSTLRLFD